MIKTITALELQKRLANDEVTLIDVREPFEHQLECIKGSHLIPLGEVAYEKLPDTTKPLVMHCRGGTRSARACERLLAQHPSLEVYNLEGGIMAWAGAGLATHSHDE